MIPHDDFQDYLRGRYYLSPSKLYSVVRLLPNKQGYDVPVCGDWLTIAVVAERAPTPRVHRVVRLAVAAVLTTRDGRLMCLEANASVVLYVARMAYANSVRCAPTRARSEDRIRRQYDVVFVVQSCKLTGLG